MSFTIDYRIRYGECDQQGIVFNAHYMAFMDDAFDCWLRELAPDFEESAGWEVMVKATQIVWQSPARFGENLSLDLLVSRWGNSSLDVAFRGHVDQREVIEGSITYVVVDHAQHQPMPIPDQLRAHLTK